MFQPGAIDDSWTLFLDRDGVINHEKHEDYIHTWDEFVFYDGVKEAFRIFNNHFKHIVIVTNQRGIAKGVTKEADLMIIHKNMIEELEAAGGRVDKIYYAPELDNDSPDRKPNPGMGLKAKRDLPGINFSKSIMVGNTSSDMQFGRNIGAVTIFLPTTRPEVKTDDPVIDAVFPTLIDFAKALQIK